MSDDTIDPDKPHPKDTAQAAAGGSDDAAKKAHARVATAVRLPEAWDDGAIEAAFADMLDARARDLVDLAAEITAADEDAEKPGTARPAVASTDMARETARKASNDASDPDDDDDLDHLMRDVLPLDEDNALPARPVVSLLHDLEPDQIAEVTARFPAPLSDECQDARSKVLALGGAADSVMHGFDGSFTRLQRLCLLSLSGDERLARRAAAADVVRQLPDLGLLALSFSEVEGTREIERLGLDLAGRVDQRAMISGDTMLHRLATGVLLLCLAWPIIRLEPPGGTDKPESGRLAECADRLDASGETSAALRATPVRHGFAVRQPMSHDALQDVLARRDGLVPLPFDTATVSISDLVLRVAAALRGQRSGGLIGLDAWAKLERVHLGLGLLLSGEAPDWDSVERSLPALAHDIASRSLNHTLHEVHDVYNRKLNEVQRKRADQMKAYKADAENLDARLDTARDALAKLGFDENGQPLEDKNDGIDADASPDEIIVCPVIANSTNSKVRDAVLGHEHMLGKPIPLTPTIYLQRRRVTLIEEFPFAIDVIDFLLGDLVNRATVTIRPVLLTGAPGSGKTHFARRFAALFDLHLWSVDCGGADGAVFAGTDRRWHSSEPCHPFLAMSRGRMANPLVLLDEIEKAPTRQDYGRLWDSLLPFLEPGSNKAVQDKCLQVAIDASHISYIATANRIDPLPWPLRDRFRVMAFPEPTRDHLDALIPPLTAELARTRGLDPRFIAPLNPEERAFLAQRWRGGSVRRLARLIEAIINARERTMPRH